MGAPYGKIRTKAEDAFEAVIEALAGPNLTGVAIFKSFQGSASLVVPRIQILCPRAEAKMMGDLFTGNYVCDMVLSVVTHYKDHTRDQREDMMAELADMVLRQDIEDRLNNTDVPDFKVFGGDEGAGNGVTVQEVTGEPVDKSFVDSLLIQVYCKPQSRT